MIARLMILLPLLMFVFASSAFADTADDAAKITDLTKKLYQAVTFEKGQRPPLDSIRTMFIKNAQIINNSGPKPAIFTVNSFIASAKEQFNTGHQKVKEQSVKGAIQAFSEKEIASKTDIFGQIAQRFSTYSASFTPDDPNSYAEGINSIQFVKVNGEWKVASLIWNDETPTLKIPAEYLK